MRTPYLRLTEDSNITKTLEIRRTGRPKVRRGFGAATAHCLQRGRARDMGAITRFLRGLEPAECDCGASFACSRSPSVGRVDTPVRGFPAPLCFPRDCLFWWVPRHRVSQKCIHPIDECPFDGGIEAKKQRMGPHQPLGKEVSHQRILQTPAVSLWRGAIDHSVDR